MSYDEEFKSKLFEGEDGQDADIEEFLNNEVSKLKSSSYYAKNAFEKSNLSRMEYFPESKTFKKLSKMYLPIDMNDVIKNPGTFPRLLPQNQIQFS